MENKQLVELNQAMKDNTKLRKAILSGISKAIEEELANEKISINNDLAKELGKLQSLDFGGPVSSDTIVVGIDSIVKAYKWRGLDDIENAVRPELLNAKEFGKLKRPTLDKKVNINNK